MLKFSYLVLYFNFTGSVNCSSKTHEMVHMFWGFRICRIVGRVFKSNVVRIKIAVFV
jgi:hypothetical protein